MKPRLYLETTIPSYLVAQRSRDIVLAGQQEATSRWWDHCRRDYERCGSQLVVSEAAQGDARMAAARMAKPDGILRLPVTAEAIELADTLIAAGLLPSTARVDAAHIGGRPSTSLVPSASPCLKLTADQCWPWRTRKAFRLPPDRPLTE